MRVWPPGREDPLEEERATHSSLLAWKNSTDRGTSWNTVHGVPKSEAWQSTHTCTIYRTLSYYFTINTTHTHPTQWVMILQLREVEGFTTTREKPRLQPPCLVAFFASISAEGCTGWAWRRLIPFPFSAHDPLKSSWSLDRGETCQLLSDEKIHRTCQGGKEEWLICARFWLGLHFQGSKCDHRKRNLIK